MQIVEFRYPGTMDSATHERIRELLRQIFPQKDRIITQDGAEIHFHGEPPTNGLIAKQTYIKRNKRG